ncbi:unnamed protein product [Ilex paraguariensis]|uniref:Uncharacterized protein n=1 Tax=Ilex paraguariensis TaxID=185542 RepID=A0ABC8SCB9_9AQUA
MTYDECPRVFKRVFVHNPMLFWRCEAHSRYEMPPFRPYDRTRLKVLESVSKILYT